MAVQAIDTTFREAPPPRRQRLLEDERWLAMALLVVFAGLETAVFWGCVGGIAVLVWRRAAGHSSEMRTRRFARGKLATPGK